MQVTVRFGNPIAIMLYSAALLMIGWAIGAHWGDSFPSGWMIFFAAIILFLHDVVIAILCAIAAANAASSRKK